MGANRIMVVGGKETILVKVLVKKIQEAGIEAAFVPADARAIEAAWNGVSLVTCYLESGERLPEDALRMLAGKLAGDGKRMVAIGDAPDLQAVAAIVPGNLVGGVFRRPVDNEEYIRAVTGLLGVSAPAQTEKSILIVDDDPNYLGLIREWLKGAYKVAMATSGMQAIKWLGKNKADLILLDYEMPVTSGPQVLEMLRSDEETRDIPVIFLTGKSDKESVMKVLSMKPHGYFLKNIAREELISRLEEFFASRT